MPSRPRTSAPRAAAVAAEAPSTPRAGRANGEVEEQAAIDPQVVVPADPAPAGGEEPAAGYPSENEDDLPGPIDPVADGALPLGDPDVVADEEEELTLEEAEAALGADTALAVAGTAGSADKAPHFISRPARSFQFQCAAAYPRAAHASNPPRCHFAPALTHVARDG